LEKRFQYIYVPKIEWGTILFLSCLASAKNFNLRNSFLMVGTGFFILHMSVPCGKTFLWGTKSFDRVTLALVFDLLMKNINLGSIF
jgi:hypothetical protein